MKKLLLFICAFSAVSLLNAQYYYVTTTGSNPGNNLNSDAEYPSGSGLPAGWTTIQSGSAATPAWTSNQVIPFSFSFNGSAVTGFKVSTSGILTFDLASSLAAPSYTKADLPSNTIPNNSVCVWGMNGIGSNDIIITKTFGTAPNRQHWICFNSYGYGTTASDGSNYTYWGIMLEETTNKIYIVDQRTGGFSGANNVSAGIQINSTTAYKITGSPNLASKAGTSATQEDNTFYEFIQGTRSANDVVAVKVNMLPDLALTQVPFMVALDIRNLGSSALTGVTINYTVNGGSVVSSNLSSGVNVASDAFAKITSLSGWTPSAAGTYNLKVWTSSPNGSTDGNPSNDTATMTVKVWDNFVMRKSLHEVFTSSTCPPCNPGNIQLQNVLDARDGKYTVIKYQYYFPGIGDPYFTGECYDRANYYGGVNSVPRLFVDGQWNNNPNGYTTGIFDSYQTKPAFMEITANQTLTGNKFDMSATFKPIIDFPTGTYKAHFVIVERKTTANIKSNGETEFHWVMKKMNPNAAGNAFTMPAKNVTTNMSKSFTFPGSYRLPPSAMVASGTPTGTNYAGINLATENSVEEFWDLIGVVFVQNDVTKEVVQSEWTTPNYKTGFREMSFDDLGLKLFPNPANSSFTLSWDDVANAKVTVYDITGKQMMQIQANNSSNKLVVDCSGLSNGIYMVRMEKDGVIANQKLIINK